MALQSKNKKTRPSNSHQHDKVWPSPPNLQFARDNISKLVYQNVDRAPMIQKTPNKQQFSSPTKREAAMSDSNTSQNHRCQLTEVARLCRPAPGH